MPVSIRPRVRDHFPFPVACPYTLVFAEAGRDGEPLSWGERRWALCFTEYQLLRVVCLALVSQYLHEPVNAAEEASVKKLNTAVQYVKLWRQLEEQASK